MLRVDTWEELSAALSQHWDIALCDYSLPALGGDVALAMLADRRPELPVLVVSGEIGEDDAAQIIRGGARDFIPKSALGRLAPAIRREVASAMRARELRRSEEAYRDLVEGSIQAIVILQRGRIVFVNPAATRFYGGTTQELLSLQPDEVTRLLHPQDRQRVWGAVGELRRGRRESLAGIEFRLLRRDGEQRTLEFSATRGQFAERPAVLVTLIDVTQAQQLREALIRGREEWETVFDSVPQSIAIADRELRLRRANRNLAERLGAPYRALLGRRFDELIGGGANYGDATDAVLQAGGGAGRDVVVDSAPLGGDFRFSITPFLDSRGNVVGTVHVGRDVTAQRRGEELARRRAAVEQTELIFRTFRHEVGNLLNTLRVTLDVLERNVDRFDGERREAYFSRCRESLSLADNLLETLRRYHAVDHVRVAPLEVAPFLRAFGGLLFEGPTQHGLRCQLESCKEGVAVLADRDALLRVLLNLIDNAQAATAGVDDPCVSLTCSVSASEVLLGVADNGHGITEEDQERVFNPFFTTKPRGSGMGLAIVQRLVHKMGARLALRSVQGRGTSISLIFPRLDLAAGAAPPLLHQVPIGAPG